MRLTLVRHGQQPANLDPSSTAPCPRPSLTALGTLRGYRPEDAEPMTSV